MVVVGLALVAATVTWMPRLVLAQDQPEIDPQLRARYQAIASQVDEGRIADTMRTLSSGDFESRVSGYPGAQRAAAFIEEQFRSIGFRNIETDDFEVSVPMDEGAYLEVGGSRTRIYGLWPNMVRTSQVATEGVQGKLVYIASGRLEDMRNKDINGSIAVIDFNSGNNFINAVRAGAAGVAFLAPENTLRGEAEAKFMSVPVDIPRFWIPRESSAAILSAAEAGQTATLTARMPWREATGRNILVKIPGSDPKLKDQIVVLSAYYDAISVAPGLAPGAEASSSIAGLLEIARVLKEFPPKRTVYLLAVDGHFQGMAGIRNWLDKNIDEFSRPGVGERIVAFFTRKPTRPRKDVYLFCGLDISSNSEGVGIFFKGYFYDARDDLKARFSDLATVTSQIAEKVAITLGRDKDVAFADGVNDIAGKNWRNFIPGKIAFDAEAVSVAGGVGVTFATLNDARSLVDTPYDTFEKTNPENVARQVRMVANIVDHYLQAPTQSGRLSADTFPIREPNAFQRIGIQGGFAQVGGQVVEYDPQKSFVPNQPIGDSIAILRSGSKSFMGVRANLIDLTDDKGNFRFPGVAPVTAYPGPHPTSLAAYRLDPDSGAIIYAPDQGAFGGEFNYTGFEVATSSKEMPVIVFPCVATSVFDLVDPQSLRSLGGLQVLDGATDGPPREYGTAVAVPEFMVSHVEDGAVIFTPPNSTIKIMMSAGPAATRLLLLNSKNTGKAADAQGQGYNVGQGGIITNTAYKTARDMWILDEYRIQKLAKYRIINQGLDKLHRQAEVELQRADQALKDRNFEAFEAYSRSAWGFEARAYPDVQRTATDVVRGVLFYLALLLPFAFFLERLFFGWSELYRQLTTFLTIFVVVALAFMRIHPAFEITSNPMIVILAFVMLALSLLVITLVSGKFEEQLRALNRQMSGVHKVDIGRMSVAAAAFSLGVSNMRRRKARTVLTCVSLILVTFIVLSFTSIVNEMRFNARPTPNEPSYQGIMLRTAMWEPLQEPAYRVLNDEFGGRNDVAPRAWFFGAALGEQSFLTVRHGDKRYDAKAAVGLSPQEDSVTNPSKALVAGRWFEPGEDHSIILPQRMAEELGVSNSDVGTAQVHFAGVPYRVIGIFNRRKFQNLKDLDGEPLTPVDFILMNKQQTQSKSMGEAGFREYQHMDPSATFIIPYNTLINLGGELRSIAINFATAEQVQEKLDTLMPRLGLNLYAGKEDTIYRYSSIGGSSTKGFLSIVIPIIIAALSVLKTMLDSVYERVREIGIFSSIGLAPNHIAMLFFAEATVYGILGAVSGYLIGQAVSKFLAETGYMQGLTLNFSSMSAVISTMLVMAIVWLSTLYPARKASEVATPAMDRSWKVPEPDGDVWTIPLPFSVTGDQARALNTFLGEWFKAYEEYSVGDFVTQDVQSDEFETEYGRGYGLSCKTWLAPFDLGVSQGLRLETVPTSMEDVFDIGVTLTRLSGDISNWKRVNRRFLNTMRKQFLIWRTLRADERDRYLSGAVMPAGAAAPGPAAK